MLHAVHCKKTAIPIQQREYIGLYVPFRMTAATRFNVARIGFVAQPPEFYTDTLALFTGYQNMHMPLYFPSKNTHSL
jgi:hypothetical protein